MGNPVFDKFFDVDCHSKCFTAKTISILTPWNNSASSGSFRGIPQQLMPLEHQAALRGKAILETAVGQL